MRMTDFERHGFDGPKAEPANPAADKFAAALLELIAHEETLKCAKFSVPNYTGQWDGTDYYAEEQHQRNMAANRLYEIVNSPTERSNE